MRQAEGDPIVYLSQCVLKRIPVDYGMYGASRVVGHVPIDNNILTDYDIILCGKNKTRDTLNDRIREEILNYEYRKPTIGA